MVADDRHMGYKRRKPLNKDVSLRVPFEEQEVANFRAYLKRTDKKAGAFARTAILAAMAKDDQK
jgi:hypothetical protein